MKLQIIKKSNLFFIFSGTLIVITLLSWIAWGLKPGIDFTGGSLMELQFKERPSNEQITESLKDFNLGDMSLQQSGNGGVIIRFKDIDEDTHHQIITKLEEDFKTQKQKNVETVKHENTEEVLATETKDELSPENISITDENGNVINGVSVLTTGEDGETIKIGDYSSAEVGSEDVSELRFDSIGASIGQELRVKSYKAMFYVIMAIILYVAWAFRKVSKPVKSWKYGVIAVIALLHDILITIGVFVFLGHFFGTEVNTPFIAALLTILGYSVNDTIVVFDRIRENLHRYHENFEETVNDSINETITRSLNTSFTTIFVLMAVYFFGGATIKDFVLALIIGMVAGTYSSIFIASPLLVVWRKIGEKLG
ncbi:MAG: protein translocase subunit SecF [bacterium]